MKIKYVILKCLFVFAISNAAFAQGSNLVIFSEDRDNFVLFINGERKNASPATNVKAQGINADGCKVKIVFQDTAIPEISKYIMLTAGEETTYGVKKNKKGEYVLRMVSSAAMPSTDSHAANTTTTVSSPQNNQAQVSTQTTTIQTTTQTSDNAVVKMNVNATEKSSENVTMSISASDAGANMNFSVNVTGNAMDQPKTKENVSVTTTTTTTSTSSNTNTNSGATVVNKNCEMSSADYQSALNAIKSKPFADTRMSTAKQALKNRCVSVAQVKGIANLFDYEDDKLDFLKHAYNFTTDKENYYTLSEVFAHASTVDELNDFLESK